MNSKMMPKEAKMRSKKFVQQPAVKEKKVEQSQITDFFGTDK